MMVFGMSESLHMECVKFVVGQILFQCRGGLSFLTWSFSPLRFCIWSFVDTSCASSSWLNATRRTDNIYFFCSVSANTTGTSRNAIKINAFTFSLSFFSHVRDVSFREKRDCWATRYSDIWCIQFGFCFNVSWREKKWCKKHEMRDERRY